MSEYKSVDNVAAGRWEVTHGDAVVAFAEYRLSDHRIILTHTVVDPQLEGRGIGSRLARTVLDDAVARGLRIVPLCPFIRAYLDRHAEYEPHVDRPAPRS